jgi:hypothetical protein
LSEAKDLAGQHVKRERDRAARRALATLIARQQILTADLFYLFDKIAANHFSRKSNPH